MKCLSVFDDFVGLVLKGLILKIKMRFCFYTKAKMKVKTPKFEKKYSTIT